MRPRIVGGSDAIQGQLGFMAFLMYFDANGNPQFLCSGTLVSANVVLTAGHCSVDESTGATLDAAGYRVVTGAVDWTDTSNRQVSDVSQVIPDPTFDSGTLANDAALLVLSAPVSSPSIPLWSSGGLAAGTGALIAGWGKSDAGDTTVQTLLQWAPTFVQSVGYCSQQASYITNYLYYSSIELCAVNAQSYSTGTCNGDSGGPLLAQDGNGNLFEIGVTSVGPSDCDTSSPDFFSSVLPIEAWVEGEANAVASSGSSGSGSGSGSSGSSSGSEPGSGSSGTGGATGSTPASAPARMAIGDAKSYVRQTLAGLFGGRFKRGHQLSLSCSRVSASRVKCGFWFWSGPNDYWGSVTVYYQTGKDGETYWYDSYRTRWVNDHCYHHTKHPASCPQHPTSGSY